MWQHKQGMLERHLAVKWSKYFPPGADVEEVHWMIMQHTFNGQSFDTNNAACVELERALDTNSISQDQQEFAAFWGNQGSQPQQADTISISEYQQLIAALSDQSEQVDANSASHCEKQDGGAIASQEEHLEEAYSHVECSRCKCHLANPFFHFTSACRTKRARSYRCVFCNTNKSSSIPFPLDGLDPVRFPSGTWGYIAKDLWDREDIRMAYARELEKVGYWWNNVQRSDDKQDCDTLLRLVKRWVEYRKQTGLMGHYSVQAVTRRFIREVVNLFIAEEKGVIEGFASPADFRNFLGEL